ncbi:hypothetical protein TrST_g980 [Triparma strigata]|uniref:Cation-transporting P-type ATPase N-terminal domain-containing protein n=1 Tax=Triparma strigata TaxID=1606541 RepID=A0A9W7C2Z8_9STRA|nr:hypothetical protein TrST_g980 [Triparma strigata]
MAPGSLLLALLSVLLLTLTQHTTDASLPPVPVQQPTRTFHASTAPLNAVLRNLIPQSLEVPPALSSTGLPSEDYVSQLSALHGENAIPPAKSKPIWIRIADEFKDTLVRILLLVALVSAVFSYMEMKEMAATGASSMKVFIEPAVIMFILVMNAAVGVKMGMGAEASLEALNSLNPSLTTLLRSSVPLPGSNARNIVPGDVILLKTGDKVPADCRILVINGGRLGADESALTGETDTVDKTTETIEGDDLPLQYQGNMLFSGTLITAGSCTAVVTSTGLKTEIGKISASVAAAKEDEEATPLQKKLDVFASKLTSIVGVICLACFFANANKFNDEAFGGSLMKGMLYYAKVAVALGVAAIPEGLPAVITLCLSLGTGRMAKKNVVVRKLPSVETLGCTSVICSDKTGTLTTNQMTATKIAYFGEHGVQERTVEGSGYAPIGSVENLERGVGMEGSGGKSCLVDFSQVAILCSDAAITGDDETNTFARVGEPTEAALCVLAEKLGAQPASSDPSSVIANFNAKKWQSAYTRSATLEFNRDRKSMGVIVSDASGAKKLLVKGAPNSIIERCTHVKLDNGKVVKMTDEMRTEIEAKVSEMAKTPLRTLALAVKTALPSSIKSYTGGPNDVANHPLLGDPSKFVSVESSLTLVGVAGIKDPARPEVAESINICTKAGIRVMMITGDAKDTAVAIARDVNIFTKEQVESGDYKAFEGREFFNLPEETQLNTLKSGNVVFCRTEPADKQKLIKMLQQLNEIPAMTGDGVNDAPALQQAAIGIAMGITGTEVAKEAADMVLVDDNFATIVAAVEEGRCIYASMQAFICFLISCNIGEIFCIFFASILGLPEPLTAMHLLWVNLVTDGPPATALGFNPPDPDVMDQTPRKPDEEIMTKWLLTRYCLTGLYVGIATVGISVWHYLSEMGLGWKDLRSWTQCGMKGYGGGAKVDCDALFSKEGRMVPQTLSLTTLVAMEMLKALSAVSVDNSLFVVPSWKNKYLLVGVLVPSLLHVFVVNARAAGFPGVSEAFGMVALDKRQWIKVLQFSAPILVLDEMLKFVGRRVNRANDLARRKARNQESLM